MNDVRICDALVHVLRAFENPNVPHVEEEINPARDLEAERWELFFADMDLTKEEWSGFVNR